MKKPDTKVVSGFYLYVLKVKLIEKV